MMSLFFLGIALLATAIYFFRQYASNRKRNDFSGRNRLTKKRPEADQPLSPASIAEQLCKNEDENVTEIVPPSVSQAVLEDPLFNIPAEPVQNVRASVDAANAPACVIALYLVAKESDYSGYELLQALLSAGLRYGKHQIFHRHEHKDGRGEVLFHCASATPPGTFDLTKMGSFAGRGICLFFTTNQVSDPLASFDCLLETLDQLVDDLGGEVLDEKQELYTKEKMIAHRSQLRVVEMVG